MHLLWKCLEERARVFKSPPNHWLASLLSALLSLLLTSHCRSLLLTAANFPSPLLLESWTLTVTVACEGVIPSATGLIACNVTDISWSTTARSGWFALVSRLFQTVNTISARNTPFIHYTGFVGVIAVLLDVVAGIGC